jgi:hypothetical protein
LAPEASAKFFQRLSGEGTFMAITNSKHKRKIMKNHQRAKRRDKTKKAAAREAAEKKPAGAEKPAARKAKAPAAPAPAKA